MEKTIHVDIDIDEKPRDRVIGKTNWLIESLEKAVELLKEINEPENKPERDEEKEVKN